MTGTHPEKIAVTVSFWADVPNDADQAEDFADRLSDAISASVDQLSLSHGVMQGSVKIVDWSRIKDD
jgi:hypothetical protein